MPRVVICIATLTIAMAVASTASASDLMGTPTPLTSGAQVQELTTSYGTDPGEQNIAPPFTNQCATGNGVGVARTAWYSIQGTGGAAVITTAGSGFDTALFAYVSSPAGPVVACNDDVSGTDLSSTVSFPTAAGTTYFIQAGTACGTSDPCAGKLGGTLRILANVAAVPVNQDVDGDGYTGAQFGGPDCNDGDARIHPGAADIPGDGIDQNCDGRDAAVPPPPTTTTPAPHPKIALVAHAHKTYTRIEKLTASRVPAGATVTVSCATKKLGCRFSSKKTSVKVTKTLALGTIVGKALTKAKLRKGARIEVRVTSAGNIGTVVRFTMGKGKPPTKATLCLPPGATKPQNTCS